MTCRSLLIHSPTLPPATDRWLRLLEVRPDGTTIQTYDYSRVRGQMNRSEQNEFTMTVPV